MRYIIFALLLFVSPALAEGGAGHGGTPIPAAASGVGYTNLTFSTHVFSTSNIDTGLTYASGFQWYFNNYFGASTPASAVTINSDGSISVQRDNNGNFSLLSMGRLSSPPYYVGTSIGCGAYITAEISFNSNAINTSVGWPSWWTLSAEHLAADVGDQWPGQPTSYLNFDEVDTFEFDRNQQQFPYSYGSTIHQYWGIFNSTCPPSFCAITTPFSTGTIKVPLGTDWSLWHRVAVLWVPATVSTNGYVTFYFDDIPFTTFSWTQFTTQAPPPGTNGGGATQPWAFGVMDQQHLALIFGSGGTPINVRSVDVWQGPAACNMTN